MATKIIIDAGHGGYDNGASYNGRLEKDDALRLALEVGKLLEQDGFDVSYTRTTDVYDSPIQKAMIANDSKADYFISIHRNSSPTPNQYNGVQTLIYDNSGIKKTMAENINTNLENVGYRNINVDLRPNLAVLRRTRMPALLVEAGFINSDTDNRLFDEKLNETAQAIADGIADTINAYSEAMSVNTPDTESENREAYSLLTGIFRNPKEAEAQLELLSEYGFSATVFEDDNLYPVKISSFESLEAARKAHDILLDYGMDSVITLM